MLDAVATLIRTAPGSPVVTIGTSLDLAALIKAPPAKVPAAFVWPVAASGRPNRDANSHRQQITEAIGITLVVRRHGDAAGARKADELQAVYSWLRSLLIGWQPDPAYDPFEFSRAGLDLMKDGIVWWTEEFVTSHQHRRP